MKRLAVVILSIMVFLTLPRGSIGKTPDGQLKDLCEAASANRSEIWTKDVPNRLSLLNCYIHYRDLLSQAYLQLKHKPDRSVDNPWIRFLWTQFEQRKLAPEQMKLLKQAKNYRRRLVEFSSESAVVSMEDDIRTPIDWKQH